MDYQVIWSDPALEELESALRYVSERNTTAAEALRINILETIARLQTFPFLGAVYERQRSGRVREIICQGYCIFYSVRESAAQIEVLTLWHGSRSEPGKWLG